MAVTNAIKIAQAQNPSMKIKAAIYLPETASEAKVKALKQMGANLIFFGQDVV